MLAKKERNKKRRKGGRSRNRHADRRQERVIETERETDFACTHAQRTVAFICHSIQRTTVMALVKLGFHRKPHLCWQHCCYPSLALPSCGLTVGRTEHGMAKVQDIRSGPKTRAQLCYCTMKLERTAVASFVSHAFVDFQWRVWCPFRKENYNPPFVAPPHKSASNEKSLVVLCLVYSF